MYTLIPKNSQINGTAIHLHDTRFLPEKSRSKQQLLFISTAPGVFGRRDQKNIYNYSRGSCAPNCACLRTSFATTTPRAIPLSWSCPPSLWSRDPGVQVSRLPKRPPTHRRIVPPTRCPPVSSRNSPACCPGTNDRFRGPQSIRRRTHLRSFFGNTAQKTAGTASSSSSRLRCVKDAKVACPPDRVAACAAAPAEHEVCCCQRS